WKPTSDKDVHDGYGWIPQQSLTPSVVVSMISRRVLEKDGALQLIGADDLATELANQVQHWFSTNQDSPYSKAERETWPQQIEEANLIINGGEGGTPMLSAIAEAEDIELETLALKVLEKAEVEQVRRIKYVATSNMLRKMTKQDAEHQLDFWIKKIREFTPTDRQQ